MDTFAKYREVIGVIGGMGSYATLDFFHRLLNAFPAEKEWERPRIIVDNRCTMPSRVRAILYNERKAEIRESLAESTRNLLASGATVLILACNTSHFFLEDIYKAVPNSKGKFINIIAALGRKLEPYRGESFLLLASEGTLDSGLYQRYLQPYGLSIKIPPKNVYPVLREMIEDVKQDKIDEHTTKKFIGLVQELNEKRIIIGCTEFPAILARCKEDKNLTGYEMFDPLQAVIEDLQSICRIKDIEKGRKQNGNK